MPLPAIWNSSTVTVDPWVLHNASVNSSAAVKNIGDVMVAVTNRLNELRLSWTGESQERADKFNSDWNAMVTQLFGTKEHPEEGILNRFCSGLATAAVGYSRGERAVSDSFAKFQGLLAGMDPSEFENKGDTDLSEIVVKHKPTTPDTSKGDPLLDNAPAENTAIDALTKEEEASHIHHTSVNQTF